MGDAFLANLLIDVFARPIEHVHQGVLILERLKEYLQASHVGWIVSICPNLTLIFYTHAHRTGKRANAMHHLFGLSRGAGGENGDF